MAAPQGLISYAGVSGILEGSYTLAHGTSPGVATLYIVPREGYRPPQIGTLVISYGGAKISFPDCRLDYVTDDISDDGREVWGLHVLDHRWRWNRGRVSGRYNVKIPDKEEQGIKSGTLKRPREIAKYCFEKLGEKKVDLSAMPNDQLPELEFDYDRPDQAIGKILDAVGCRVILGPSNAVRIVKAGKGKQLPKGNRLNISASFNPPEAPDTIVFAGARQLWNADIPLEAVGRDTDGSVKPIDSLSYKPADGWEYADPPHFHNIENQKARELARETVFRWYRIKQPFTLPGVDAIKVKDIENVLPIEDRQARTAKFMDKKERLPAWVYGKYCPGQETTQNNVEAIVGDLTRFPQTLYTLGFSIDAELGIVKFSNAVWRFVDAPRIVGSLYKPAELFLRTAVGFRDAEGGWLHKEIERKTGARTGVEPEYITRDDVSFMTWKTDAGAVETNEKEYKEQAKHYLDAKVDEYKVDDPSTATYVGFVDIGLDGAIQQVTWTLDSSGKATTRASRNREEILTTPTYEQRRFLERQNAALAARQRGARV